MTMMATNHDGQRYNFVKFIQRCPMSLIVVRTLYILWEMRSRASVHSVPTQSEEQKPTYRSEAHAAA